jgi:hypothetical protein
MRTVIAKAWTLALVGGLSLGTVSFVGAGSAVAMARTDPRFPSVPMVDNPLFPLEAGTSYIYDGTTGTKKEHEVAKVSPKVKVIDGIPCAQVIDSNWVRGRLVERTLDWYAQDFDGNVWYMGEFATQYKDGVPVGHEGSWKAGTDGAKAGIIMEAHPRVGDTYDQEDYPGVAEDRGKVLAVDASVSTPFGVWINQVLLTKDYSAIEPGVEHKFYVPGIGLVKSADVKGGSEVVELTGIQHAP